MISSLELELSELELEELELELEELDEPLWVGFCVLKFLWILYDFLSREKLTQKWPDPKAEQFENFNFQVKKWPKHQFFQTTKCQMVILV